MTAATAVRGGLPEEVALKSITIHGAEVMRLDDRIGSLEVGKDADFVVWSALPLSTYAICEQTWIEGAKYFDLVSDRGDDRYSGRGDGSGHGFFVERPQVLK